MSASLQPLAEPDEQPGQTEEAGRDREIYEVRHHRASLWCSCDVATRVNVAANSLKRPSRMPAEPSRSAQELGCGPGASARRATRAGARPFTVGARDRTIPRAGQ